MSEPTTMRVDSDGVSLHVRTWGEPRRTPLVLVHGYPDNHQVWLPVAERLAERFYVIVYDVRGAGRSDVPARVRDYRLPQLAQDLQAVTDALAPGRGFHLAAHDWGSIQSWEAVTTEPLKSRILSFTSISGPCLDHVGSWMRERLGSLSWREQRKALKQLRSSWYIMLFQVPLFAPLAWRLGVGSYWPRFLEKVEGVRDTAPNPFQTRDGEQGIKLYRANFAPRLLRPQARHARAPVQLIVPTGDHYVGAQLFEDLDRWVPHLYRREVSAGHWVQLSHPELIANWIGDFAIAMEGNTEAFVPAARA